ncbi:flavin monooxygenase-like protein [Gaertneriomyces semiglobifer]|nr:flavin monooxygenase-like protein [Gaertneriomyces semiglobifer]
MPLEVAIIGAGVSGLVAAKELLAVNYAVTVFERNSTIGGLWTYTEDASVPSVMRQTVLNLTKTQMGFSDFPVPKELPDYMPHDTYYAYLESYARHFDLHRHIRFGAAVKTLQPMKGDQWTLETHDGESRTFDKVVICVGQNQVPFIPQIEGLETFAGDVIHSSEYKTFEPYKDRKALVVGVANSGADVAVDLAGNAAKVLLSGRHGIWLFPRFAPFGTPLDHLHSRNSLANPPWLTDKVMKLMNWVMTGDLTRFGVPRAEIPPTSINPVVNDQLGPMLRTQKVLWRNGVRKFAGNSVGFVDGKREEVDLVVFATGFKRSFGFLPPEEVCRMTGQPEPDHPSMGLYKRIISVEYPTLAFVGHIHGLSHSAVAELQARWLAAVWNGDVALPSTDVMKQEIAAHAEWTRQYQYSSLATTEIPALPYMDSLAVDIGCMPRISRWHQPILKRLVERGTFSPAQYRLKGSGHWKGAEDYLLQVNQVVPTRALRWWALLWPW